MLLEIGGKNLAPIPEVMTLDSGLVSLAGRNLRVSHVGTHKGLCPTRRRCSFCPDSSV